MTRIVDLLATIESHRILNPIDSDFLLYTVEAKKIKTYTRFEFHFLSAFDSPASQIKHLKCVVRTKGGTESTLLLHRFLDHDTPRLMTAIVETETSWDDSSSLALVQSYSTYSKKDFNAEKWIRLNLSDDQKRSQHLEAFFQNRDFNVFPKVQDDYWQCGCGLIHSHAVRTCSYCKMEFIEALRFFQTGYQETIREYARKVPIEIKAELSLNENIEQHINKLKGYGLDSELANEAIDLTSIRKKYKSVVEVAKLTAFIDQNQLIFDFNESLEENLEAYRSSLIEQGFSQLAVQVVFKRSDLDKRLRERYHDELEQLKNQIRDELKQNPMQFVLSTPFSDTVSNKVEELHQKGYPLELVYVTIMETDPESEYRNLPSKISWSSILIILALFGAVFAFLYLAGGN